MKVNIGKYRVKGKAQISLADYGTRPPEGLDRQTVQDVLMPAVIEEIKQYQEKLSAENTRAIILVLQGMDAAGKDGTVKRVFAEVNPAGLRVVSFKAPTNEERDHDYLWRINRELPARGMIGVFNRSHYEDVVTARVHDLVQNGQLPESVRSSKNVWDDRYRQISNWEKYLHDNGFYMIKVFLNISKEEQAKRLAERLFDKNKHYKFEMSDITEREYWEDYQRLYAEVMTRSSTSEAPWFVVPADKKWFSSYVVALIVRDALKAIDPQFPELPPEKQARLEEFKLLLRDLRKTVDKDEVLRAADKAASAAAKAVKAADMRCRNDASAADAAFEVLREEASKLDNK